MRLPDSVRTHLQYERFRLLAVVVIILSASFLVFNYAAWAQEQRQNQRIDDPSKVQNITSYVTEQDVGDTGGITVITGKAAPRVNGGGLYAFGPTGDLIYYNNSIGYGDVDPSRKGSSTVLYTAAKQLNKSECGATVDICTRQYVQRLNLTTDEVETLHSHITPYESSTNWHDLDRLNEHEVVVADIYRDSVFILNTTTGHRTWEWSAQLEFDPSSGGPFPRDWTHINDVEIIDNETFMLSLRNQDQVVFVNRSSGMVHERTLGAEDNYDILYEQHNPDFIPESRGGPAILVADSHNERVVEYQHVGGGWEQTWQWRDQDLHWPRDADRLPNGNTLIVDSNGGRVLEIDQEGEIIWSVEIALPYDAERLGTGDESTGGASAQRLDLPSRTIESQSSQDGPDLDRDGNIGIWDRGRQLMYALIPVKILNGIRFILPNWFNLEEFFSAVVLLTTTTVWGVAAWMRSDLNVELRTPIRLRRD